MLLLICNAQLLDLFLEEVTGLELLATLNVKELEDRSVGKKHEKMNEIKIDFHRSFGAMLACLWIVS